MGQFSVGINSYPNLQVFQPQIKEMEKLHQQWISDLAIFKNSLRAGSAEPMTIEYVEEAFGRLAERIKGSPQKTENKAR